MLHSLKFCINKILVCTIIENYENNLLYNNNSLVINIIVYTIFLELYNIILGSIQ